MNRWYDTVNRAAVLDLTRVIGDEELTHSRRSKELLPRPGELAVGGAHFDDLLAAEVRRVFVACMHKGGTPGDAAEAAKAAARHAITVHNRQRPADPNWSRWEGAGDAAIAELESRALAAAAQPRQAAVDDLVRHDDSLWRVISVGATDEALGTYYHLAHSPESERQIGVWLKQVDVVIPGRIVGERYEDYFNRIVDAARKHAPCFNFAERLRGHVFDGIDWAPPGAPRQDQPSCGVSRAPAAARGVAAPLSQTSPGFDDGWETAPARYTRVGRETIDRIRDLAHELFPNGDLADAAFQFHCLATALKYEDRASSKGPAIQDLQKAAWYLEMAGGVDDPRALRVGFVAWSRQPVGQLSEDLRPAAAEFKARVALIRGGA